MSLDFTVEYMIGVELCIEDVDLSKSITKPFDPLLIVRDPYNSRIIKIATLHSYQESILECICFFGGHHSTTLTSKELIPLTRAVHLSLMLMFLLGSR